VNRGIASLSERQALSATAQEAVGALEAQQVVDGLREGSIEPQQAWIRFIELNARLGRNSPAARAFICELAKRIA
jgi:hypothetical protein